MAVPRSIRFVVLSVLTLSAPCLAQVGNASPPKLRALELSFGVYTSSSSPTMYREFSPVLEHLRQDLETRLRRPVDITLKIYKTYEAGIEAIVTGAVDFTRIGPSSYVHALTQNPELQLLVMEANEGTNRFQGIVIVRKDSPIKDLADLKGRSFAFGDENSTIGRYLAQALMAQAGIHAKDLARYAYVGRHDKVVKAVEVGDFDAGAAKPSAIKKAHSRDVLRTIATFDNVTQPWVARGGLDAKICEGMRRSLLELKNPDVLIPLDVSGFLPTTDGEYDLVRNGMKLSRQFEEGAGAEAAKPGPVR